MPYWLLTLTLFVSAGVYSAPLWATETKGLAECSNLLPEREEYAGYLGEPAIHAPFNKSQFETHNILFLGEGEGGGRVYRLIEKATGHSKVIKVYNTPDQLTNDLQALSMLRSLMKDSPVGIVQSQRRGQYKMEVQDIRGHTLRDVLNFGLVPREERDRLKNEYADFLFALNRGLLERYEWRVAKLELDIYRPDLTARVETPNKPVKETAFFIKDDNFIVEEGTFKLYLIDPY